MEPVFKHDGCQSCRLRGNITYANGEREDLWTCRDTVMRRYGDDGPDYHSAYLGTLDQLRTIDPQWAVVAAFLNDTGGVH